MVVARSNRRMWFGTKEFSTWIPCPLSGADGSPTGWGESGTYLNGGGFAMTSRSSHKRYVYEWKPTSNREDAQLMKSFYDGSFGRGKIYFIEPGIMNTNILPARWADPSITVDFEGPSLVPGVDPSAVPTSNFQKNRLPAYSASYNLNTAPVFNSQSPDLHDGNSVYVPVPDGGALYVWSFYESSDVNAGVYITYADMSGKPTSSTSRLTPVDPSASLSPYNPLVSGVVIGSGYGGAYLHIGKTENVAATVSVAGLMVRAVSDFNSLSEATKVFDFPYWIGGQGHSGVRFEQPPTYVTNSGVNGGQVSYAATFVESVI